MTHDELLLWLNDRCGPRGRPTLIVLTVNGREVLHAWGKLRHWQRNERRAAEFTAHEEVAGLYLFGGGGLGGGLDISDLDPDAAHEVGVDQLSIALADGVELRVSLRR